MAAGRGEKGVAEGGGGEGGGGVARRQGGWTDRLSVAN